MKKKIILLLLLLVILGSVLIPVTQQETIPIKASFLNVYSLLAKPENWEKWRPDLEKMVAEDSGKISIKNTNGSFVIGYNGRELEVRPDEGSFDIHDQFGGKTADYNYFVVPVQDKDPNKTSVTVSEKTNAIGYLAGKLGRATLDDTHIADLKNFLEIDSLRYGCRVFKTRIPESNLIVIRKEVLAKDKFIQAAKMLSSLQQYLKTNNLKQMQPLIAQFLPKGKDSTQVNVGLFIDKEVKSARDIIFTRMPKGGPLYAAKFSGRFDRRQKVYNGIHRYYTDHLYQSAILPFETYFDNKLPVSDTDKINIQVNFSAYF